LLAAVFQLFDGVQVVTTGILRGTGDTRTPMISNLIGHWLIGLPVGYAFCFFTGGGVFGLWIGLSLGLILVGAVLLWVWSRRVVSLKKEWRTLQFSFGLLEASFFKKNNVDIQYSRESGHPACFEEDWIPAFAGMTHKRICQHDVL
jgi:hypothetical protein